MPQSLQGNHKKPERRTYMQYLHTCSGIFQNRPNRFIANVLIDGQEEVSHVKNTSRCGELFLPETPVILKHPPGALKKGRRSAWDLVSF